MGFANGPDRRPYPNMDDTAPLGASNRLSDLERVVSRFVGYGGLGIALIVLVAVGFGQL